MARQEKTRGTGYELTVIGSRISNCYLLRTENGHFLVDTGVSFLRGTLERTMMESGCGPGDLKLVIVTHADFDHTGNCAWLQSRYRASIGVHRDESTALVTGRMFSSRKNRRGLVAESIVKLAGKAIFRPFKPDVYLEDGSGLSEYGLDARIVHLPGHTTGHIGLLTGAGDLFCGDLLGNEKSPSRFSLVDDEADMDASIARLKAMPVSMVYPGHGKPFAFSELK